MRFAAAHKMATYLLCAFAYAALASSEELSGIVVIGTGVGIVASWFWEPPRVRLERWTLWWNAVALGAFGYSILDILSGGSWIHSGAHLLLFLLVAKLFQRRAARDYQWLYVVTFLMLVAGSTLNTELSYAVFFLGYVVCATWCLILYHLRHEMEDNFLVKHSDDTSSQRVEVERILSSRRIVGPTFLGVTGAVSIGIFVVLTVLFFLFPRIGFGMFFQRQRQNLAIAGFSDQVQLGGHGLIRDDETVVMRVKVSDPRYQGADAAPLHWRGAAYDHYQDGEWSRRLRTEPPGYTEREERKTNIHIELARPGPTQLVQEVYLEPLDSATIFGASMPKRFELSATAVGERSPPAYLGSGGEVRFPHSAGIRYVVVSDVDPPSPRLLAQAEEADPTQLAAFLQIPDEIPGEVYEKARQITHGQTTPYAKAVAIQEYLNANYGYTLEMKHDPSREPIAEFLFDRKEGHCEYFSSAMTILLRAVGVPARNVNGFYGGEWNEYGGYIAVRGGDAHSWVEVYLPPTGWVTFDPTPAASVTKDREGGFLGKMRRLLDTLRLTWFKWVIEYDLSRQIGMFKSIKNLFGLGPGVHFGFGRSLGPFIRAHKRGLAITGGLAVLAITFLVWRRRRVGPVRGGLARPVSHPILTLYARTAAVVGRRGYRRSPSQTPRAHAQSLAQSGAPFATPFAALTEIYYTVRFCASDAMRSSVDVVEAQRLARAVREALRGPAAKTP